MRDITQNTRAVLLETVKSTKNKGSLRNRHGQEEPKEKGLLNVRWYRGTKKKSFGKI